MSTFPLPRPARLAVLASGRGSNLRALAEAFPPDDPLASVTLVISDRADAGALPAARARSIEAVHLPWTDRAGFEAPAEELIGERGIDLICLAGFMRILSPGFAERFAGRLLNIHPSLLPAFPGLDPHSRVLRAGVPESGCSVHFVDAGVDTGPVILQRSVPVLPADDPAALAARVLEQEHCAYPEAVRLVLRGEARFVPRSETGAGS